MQEISSTRYAGIIESNDALVSGVRGMARRAGFFVGTGLTAKATKLAMPVSPSSTPRYALPSRLRGERSEGGVARQSNRFANFLLPDLLGRLNKSFLQSRTASLASRHEIEIMYFGRTSEFLMMTSERMVIPTGRYTLGQLLCSLYKRGERWAYELDDSHLLCTVDGREAGLFDKIAPGAEICLSSTKSMFEA